MLISSVACYTIEFSVDLGFKMVRVSEAKVSNMMFIELS